MEEWLTHIVEGFVSRVSGPLHFRLILQPLMAAIFAIRDGLKDAREGNPAYFWAIFTNPDERKDLLRQGWKSVSKVFFMAVLIDGIYQYIALRWFHPMQALTVAFVLALVPYLVLRGPVNRIARMFKSWK